MYSKCYHSVNRRIASFLFCLSFANHASDSGDLYIDFNRNHLIFPAAYLVCQVDALFILFPPEARIHIVYHISHIMTCIASCCLCIAPWFIVVPLLLFLLWVEPGDEYVHEEPVEYANEDQAFDNSENFAGKMTIPSISLLSLLASTRSIAMLALPATVYHASLLPCQTSHHPVLANRCLSMSPLLLSPFYSVVSCRWRWSLFLVGTRMFWDITISPV